MSGPAPPGGPTPQQLAQMRAQFIEEAKRQGISPEELQARQRAHLQTEATKQGLTIEQYVVKLREHSIRQAQQAQQQGQQGQTPQGQQQVQQQIPVNPGAEAKPEAVAVAKFLRSQDLKTRVCILDGQRKDMFKGTTDCNDMLRMNADVWFSSQASKPRPPVTRLCQSPKQEPSPS